MRRRVARLRSAILQSGGDARISTLVRTLGFATPSHGSRAFKAAYGLAPGQRRAKIRAPEGRVPEDLEPGHLRDWIRRLNGSSRSSRTRPEPSAPTGPAVRSAHDGLATHDGAA